MPLLSPIQRLPAETLSEIFIFCVFDKLSRLWFEQTQNFKRGVMLPASICRHWREVALSTPRLWSSIRLELTEESQDADVTFTRLWLSRSGALPLTLRLKARRYNRFSVHPVLDVLIEYAERWHHVDFEMSYPMWNHARQTKNRLPRLHTLAISGLSDAPAWPALIDTFEVAPQLTSVSMGYGVSLHVLQVPWTQLTAVKVYDVPEPRLDWFHETLQRAPNLRKCRVVIRHSRVQYDNPIRDVIHHGNLRTLKIASDRPGLGPLLDRISLPALRSFTYKDERRSGWPHTQFVSFLSRSSCSLRTLVIGLRKWWKEDELIECLHLLPSLVHLELIGDANRAMTDKTLARLTLTQPTSQHNCLVPKLRFLGLHSSSQFREEALTGMVESRQFSTATESGDIQQPRVYPLETLQLHVDEHPGILSPSTVERLRNCVQTGLQLDLRVPGAHQSRHIRVELEPPAGADHGATV